MEYLPVFPHGGIIIRQARCTDTRKALFFYDLWHVLGHCTAERAEPDEFEDL